jgi:NAD(P)H dehydrogenase (quinone)
MTSVPILIGGAAGASGSVATKLLLQMGFPVRAIVRGDDERARPLRALGAEVFVADLLDLRAVRRAFQ